MEVTHNARNDFDDDGFSVLCFSVPCLALVLPCCPRCDGNQALFEGHEKKVKKVLEKGLTNPFSYGIISTTKGKNKGGKQNELQC